MVTLAVNRIEITHRDSSIQVHTCLEDESYGLYGALDDKSELVDLNAQRTAKPAGLVSNQSVNLLVRFNTRRVLRQESNTIRTNSDDSNSQAERGGGGKKKVIACLTR